MTAKLTPTEKAILKSLTDAWETFKILPCDHPQETPEFLAVIHRAQAIIARRVARRIEPDFWRAVVAP